MESKNEHFRHILLFYFRKGKNAAQAAKKLRDVYGEEALKERQCRYWFEKFRSGDFSLKDEQRTGRPMKADDEQIKTIIELDRHVTEREIGEKLKIPKSTIHDHIKRLGLVKKLDIWVPHQLKEIHLTKRIDACDVHLKRNESDPFLKRIITGDEKWIIYDNVNRKRSWSKHDEPPQTISKADIHQKKILLSIWWDWKGVVYFELLPRNQMINTEVYCRQLDQLNAAIMEKRPELVNRRGVIFHQDNARPHTSLITRQKLMELGWELMLHPPYSPDLAPSDYYLFRSLQNHLKGKTFNDDEAVKLYLDQFFADKNQKFYERGIMKLPERWRKVIEQNGNYIID